VATFFGEELSGDFGMLEWTEKTEWASGRGMPDRTLPPTILYECQKKGLTEIVFRNSLILKGAILVVLDEQQPKWLP
jgi:hypothetical protein